MSRGHFEQPQVFLNAQGPPPGIGRPAEFALDRPEHLDRTPVHQVIVEGLGDHGLDQADFHVNRGRVPSFGKPLFLVSLQVTGFRLETSRSPYSRQNATIPLTLYKNLCSQLSPPAVT